MVAWLSDWLRDIIAIILLAVIVELILPNKTMQRYARLVVGLFILLTILSPIMKLLQSDLQSKLDIGMTVWDSSALTRQVGMAGLEEIKSQGERLSESRSKDAARITEMALEQNILKELRERAELAVDSVEVALYWMAGPGGDNMPAIGSVQVTLSREKEEQAHPESDSAMKRQEVDEVKPVYIQIEPSEVVLQESLRPEGGSEKLGGAWAVPDEAVVAMVKSIVIQGWGVERQRIEVRQASS